MGGLEIEGFLDLGVRGYEEVEDDDGWKEEGEEEIWRFKSALTRKVWLG